VTRIEASRNHQAPTIPEPHLNACTPQCPGLYSRLRTRLRQLHFYKRCSSCFPQSSLPVDKLRSSQFPIPAKRRYTLPALLLLGNQTPPLRPSLLSTLIHVPSLPQSALADKMWFRYRSRQICDGSPPLTGFRRICWYWQVVCYNGLESQLSPVALLQTDPRESGL
jgi:hypothetical protein